MRRRGPGATTTTGHRILVMATGRWTGLAQADSYSELAGRILEGGGLPEDVTDPTRRSVTSLAEIPVCIYRVTNNPKRMELRPATATELTIVIREMQQIIAQADPEAATAS
jgi:hypothetical protein